MVMQSTLKRMTLIALVFVVLLALAGLRPADATFVSNQISRVSVASDGTQGNNYSRAPALSADGRIVVFASEASNLVGGDTNGVYDIFVHDRQTGQTTRVSVASDGTQANWDSYSPALSADGRTVAIFTEASNLVGDDTNAAIDVFVHDRQTGQTTRVSLASDGTQGNGYSYSPALSADGRTVAFASDASNLVGGDTNGMGDIFIHDRQTGQTTRVSVASDGTQANDDSLFPALSADGRYVAFISYASNLVGGDTNTAADIFVHDRQTGQTTRVSLASNGAQGNYDSFFPALSADGRYVAFQSAASNLVGGDTNFCTYTACDDIFVHDRQTGQTTRLSVASDGTQGNDHSYSPALSADGRTVAFYSVASNLVGGDTNSSGDVFVARNTLFEQSKDTVGIFRPATTTFYLRNSNSTGPAEITAAFGAVNDQPVAGDWNGDGVDTIGVYRSGVFHLKDANSTAAPVAYQFMLGNPGDLPMAGDWDADGKDSAGVFRPTNGRLYLKNALSTGFADFAMVLGINGDRPVAGDWNGDGYDSPGVYRPSNSRFYLTNQRCNCVVFADYQLQLGNVGDVGFAGDWNGDGLSTVGVFRPTNGITYLRNALTTGFADVAFVYGIANDKPIAGRWVAPSSSPQSAPMFEPKR